MSPKLVHSKDEGYETVTRRSRSEGAIRVSRYLKKDPEHVLLLSETILYTDGVFTLHLYDESGKIRDVIKYDGNGDITPLSKFNLTSK